MKRFVPTSFFGQLMLSTILVQTLFLGFFIWYTVVTQRQAAEVRSRERMDQEMNLLSAACARGLERQDDASIDGALELSRIAQTINVARLTNLDGETVAVSSNGRGSGLDAAERAMLPGAAQRQIFRSNEGGLEAVTPVLEAGNPVALLWLEPTEGVSQRTTYMVVRIAMTYGGFALLANILPIFVIVQTMTRPLQRLRVATSRVVQDPELNAGFPLPVTATNEAGQLTVSFNAMVKELEEQRREQARSEEVLRRTEKLAAAGRLAASIAHEINNPLEAVTNLLYLLQTHEGLDDAARELVSTAEAELARVGEITQQTLRFYRQSTFPSRVSVTEIMSSIAGLYQQRMTAAGVTVEKRFRGDAEVFGFGGELRQLFANLIGNALDAMPRSGMQGQSVLRLSVMRGYGRGGDGEWSTGVRVAVTDTGCGMSEETRRRIFEAFFTTKEATGTGLGLWVSEEIIRKHGGTMRVRSRQGERSGTSFSIFLPDVGED